MNNQKKYIVWRCSALLGHSPTLWGKKFFFSRLCLSLVCIGNYSTALPNKKNKISGNSKCPPPFHPQQQQIVS